MNKLNRKKILSIKNLKVYFPLEKTMLDRLFSKGRLKFVHAVDDINLDINESETLGLVGESGSGKSTLGYSIIGLVKILEGSVDFSGTNISNLKSFRKNKMNRNIQMIFQDPFSSLNPTMSVKEIIGRQFHLCNYDLSEKEIVQKIVDLVKDVGLPEDSLVKLPHEFSGGQKQRISIVRALAPGPKLIIADEVTSSLDVSIQSQILDILLKMKDKLKLSMIYITHDLRVARLITDVLAVMYTGKIVEYGKTREIFENPIHPYTRALLSSIPRNNYKNKIFLEGETGSSINPPNRCRLYGRCPLKTAVCKNEDPELREIRLGNRRYIACHMVHS